MKLFEPLIIAFSMYSKIPVPTIMWNEKNMRYMICFFPIVGIPIAIMQMIWFFICGKFSVGTILTSAVATAIPLIITGGIHLDGLCDTIDGLSSHQSIEKKLKILSDPNSGAFAVIGCITYIMINFALWTEIVPSFKALMEIGIFYVICRSASGFSIVTFQLAKNTGLAAAFSDGAQKKNVRITMIVYICVLSIAACLIEPVYGVMSLIAVALIFFYYKHMSRKEFGGITGDLAGFFLQMAEISVLISIVLAQKFFGIR